MLAGGMSASESERLLAGKNGERLRASIAQLGGWQPIETAPLNREIILWNGEEVTSGWHSMALGWASAFEIGSEHGLDMVPPPTHWMPLPNPPA